MFKGLGKNNAGFAELKGGKGGVIMITAIDRRHGAALCRVGSSTFVKKISALKPARRKH